jgi:2,4-dienoyl-CoA reductase-like NADH-dependent reductase (Old Yellow Enzyme family)
VPYAEEIKKAHPDLAIGAVGLITEPKQAEEIVKTGQADVVRLAREFLRDPNFTIRAAAELGASVKPPNQYERAWAKMMTPAEREESVRERAKEQGSA